ncbi:MAG: hypothetical protein V1850_02435 [Candidatus Bathyarchaeota archaeon]
MTIIIDDAGSGDLLFGVVVGAYRSESHEFKYDVVDVRYFQPPLFRQKEYLNQVSKTIFKLLEKLDFKEDESIFICTGSVFDNAVEDLKKKYGEDRIQKVKVIGEAQCFTEMAYLDEIRNLGYEPLLEREEKRAKSFHHMMRWLERNPDKITYAKTGWPRLIRYRLFRSEASKFTA